MNRHELKTRFIDFADLIIGVSENLNYKMAAKSLSNQLSRSGTSSALNFAEALAAESHRDFIHKYSIVLKELRETMMSLRIIEKSQLIQDKDLLDEAIKENNELISIFVATLKTLKRK